MVVIGFGLVIVGGVGLVIGAAVWVGYGIRSKHYMHTAAL